MLKKITSILLLLSLIPALFSCKTEEKRIDKLPPVTTVGLPEKEKVTTSFESDGFIINIYESYSEIAEYTGKEAVVTVPDAFMGQPVKSIGEYAFFENETVTKITLPDSLLVIGKSAFQDCSALTEVVLGQSVELIGQAAFRDSSLEKINLPDSVAEIERYAFYRTRITELKLPSGLSSVQKYVFYGCERLTKLELCPRLDRIAEYAFSACTSLTEIILTERVELIGDYAFSDCTSLQKIFVPKNTGFGENPFLGSTNVTIYSPAKSKVHDVAKKNGYNFKECASANKMP